MIALADLAGSASAILNAFVGQLEGEGVTVPAARFTYAGQEPAWDGEQLAVGLSGVRQGQPGAAIGTAILPPQALAFHVEWFLTLVRVAPAVVEGPMVAALPTQAEVIASGVEVMGDAGALVKAYSQIAQHNLLVPAGAGIVMDSCQPLAVQGGLVGTRLTLSASAS